MSMNAEIREVVQQIRLEVAELHNHLPRNSLVVWTAGNVSARVPGRDLLVIKPSGVSYDELSADNMVVTDLDANLVEGDHAPSSDTAAHAYVYKHMPEVGGVVHTHSTYATAWAARGEPIPCVLTMIADEFGGDIPVGPFALIGDDSVGRGIVETLSGHRSPDWSASADRAIRCGLTLRPLPADLWPTLIAARMEESPWQRCLVAGS